MANEYLRRANTSGGNRKQWTWSGWVKRSSYTGASQLLFSSGNPSVNTTGQQEIFIGFESNNSLAVYGGVSGSVTDINIASSQYYRDSSSFLHIIVSFDTTLNDTSDRIKVYVNGAFVSKNSNLSYPAFNYDTSVNRSGFYHNVGGLTSSGNYFNGELVDTFFIDGQALTPDVFGFYKQGKGYISVGSTQATDFRPGQWVPKTPRVIKTEINRRGGFGVNGFYLPMNDSRNFGADFHGEPNSIITLNEKLPQPRVGVASTAVGIGYTDALRADPYAANLVLALPFVSGGLQSGFGDYAPSIKGSGSTKVGTASGSVSIASTASYYGSAVYFNGSSGNYFSIPDNSDFEFGSGDYTVEFWCNPSRSINTEEIVSKGLPWQLYRNSSGQFALAVSANNSSYWVNNTIGVGAINQWHHISVSRKGSTTYGFLNGVCGLAVTNSQSVFDGTSALVVGSYDPDLISYLFQGYLQDLRVYKGVAKYTGGFDVPRPYTPVGIATWRAVPDCTANNFATLNPLSSPTGSDTMTNGNLDYTGPSAWRVKRGTFQIPTTGKWYFEARLKGSGLNNTYNGVYAAVGLCTDLAPVDGTAGILTTSNLMLTDTGIVKNFTTAALSASDNTVNTGSALSSGDVISLQIDRDANTYNFLKNGVSINSGTMNITAGTPLNVIYISYSNQQGQMTMNFGQNPTFSGNTTAGTFTDTSGKGLFKYQPPSGFLALCEDNLPTPAISDPGKYFRSVLYTGDGNNGRSIVGVGFTPDLVWIKARNIAYSNRLFDSVRGTGIDNFLLSNLTSAEGDYADQFGGISSFNSDGFSMVFGSRGSNIGINNSGSTFVAWCWRAGAGTTSTNTNGSITSVVSVNQDAGFSIVSFTAQTSGSATVGHGLGKVPAFWIYKPRSNTTGWYIYHKSLGSSAWLQFTTAAATTGNSAAWGGVDPTSSVLTHGSGLVNQGPCILYAWAEIEGLSKFGSFVGNGNADGPFIFCNFSPAFVLIKRATGGTGNWAIFDNSRDSTNPVFGYLVAESSAVEERGTAVIDFTSNGFKIRNSWTTINSSGDTIIFAAFAQSPFAYSNSK